MIAQVDGEQSRRLASPCQQCSSPEDGPRPELITVDADVAGADHRTGGGAEVQVHVSYRREPGYAGGSRGTAY